MVEYSKVNVKLSDTQLKKLKTAVKNKTRTTLRISLKLEIFGNNKSASRSQFENFLIYFSLICDSL